MKTLLVQRFVCFTLAAATLFTLACGSKPKAAQASRDLALTIIQSNHQDASASSQNSAIEEKRLYVDASLSMRGFVNPQNHSDFDQVIDELGDVLSGCRVFKYGQRGSEPPANVSDLIVSVGFGREIHEPQFYSLTYNPDDRLIEQLTAEPRPVLSVLLTDGVYSEPAGSTSPPVVNAMQRWLEKGRLLGIFMFKSSFNGMFYSELGRSISTSKVAVKARPFYAFVFSPTDEALTDIQEKLQRRFPSMQSMRFTDDAVDCESTLNDRIKGTYSYRKPPNTPFSWHMLDSSVFSGNNFVPIRYSLKCTIAPYYPVASINVAIMPEYYHWQNGKFQKIEELPAGYKSELMANGPSSDSAQADNASRSSSSTTTEFVVQFPRDKTAAFSFYYLKLMPSIKEIRSDLSGLSTRDDRELSQAGRTYRFRELLSAITNVHFKTRLASRASAAMFITLENN